MIVTIAVPKGGVGKSTMIRALASVATEDKRDVVIIDADQRFHIHAWGLLLEAAENKPANLEIIAATTPLQVMTLADEKAREGKTVFIDTEGTTNDMLSAGLVAADLVVVPIHFSFDDVKSALNMITSHFPVVEEQRGEKLKVLLVANRNSVIDKRARALEDVRAVLTDSGIPMAQSELMQRIAYKDMQTGRTLFNGGAPDQKAIEETRAVLQEIIVAAQTDRGQ